MSIQFGSKPLIPQPLPGTVALFGTSKSTFAFTQVESTFLESLLPNGLELAPQTYTPEVTHPLLLMFNRVELQSNMKIERIAREFNLGIELNYNEFIVMLPYVQFKDKKYNKDGPFCFLPRLLLDSLLAVLGGRIFWEFNKDLARFKVNENNYTVSSEILNSKYFDTIVTTDNGPVLDSELPNFKSIEPILNLPVIEHGIYGYVTSFYEVEYQNQMITPCEMRLSNESFKYLPKGLISSPSILQSPLGCFNLNYNWTLTYAKFITL